MSLSALARFAFACLTFVTVTTGCILCWIIALFGFVLPLSTRQELSLIVAKLSFGLPIHLSPWIQLRGSNTASRALNQLAKIFVAREPGKQHRPIFLLGNHSSFFDTMLVVYLLPWRALIKTRTYMKADLLKIPLLSTICKGCGHFPVYFTSSDGDKFSVDKAKMAETQSAVQQHIDSGGLLAFFPEGRMNPNPSQLDPFRYGSFTTALNCDSEIWFMVTTGAEVTWPMKAQIGGLPARVGYDVACYTRSAKAKVEELRKKSTSKDIPDEKLLAEDCRTQMQLIYNRTLKDPPKKQSGKRDMPVLELILDLACFGTFPFLCYALRDRPSDLIEFFVFILVTIGGIKFCKALFHIIGTKLQTAERATKKRNIRKFRDQSWQLSLHVIMALFEVAIMFKTDWIYFYDRTAIFSQDEMDPWIRRLYLAQLAAWFYTAFSHRFVEAHHKDYFVMYSHHAVTILLICISFRPRLINVGYLVLLAHDISDISVDLLKMTNYLGLDCKSGIYAVEVIFSLNLLSWITFRLVWFPFYMVSAAITHGPLCCSDAQGTLVDYAGYAWMRLCTALLTVLVGMHVWWFFLFVRLAFRLLREDSHKVGADEYEGTSDSEVDRPIVMAKED